MAGTLLVLNMTGDFGEGAEVDTQVTTVRPRQESVLVGDTRSPL